MEVRNTVHEARTALHMSQEELARQVGVTRQTIIAIERGNYTPSVLLALRLAQVFQVPVDRLFTIVE